MNLTNAKEAKSLYDYYRAERESLGLNPKIFYLDEKLPGDFKIYAYINKDYRDSIDLIFQIMQETKEPIKDKFYQTKQAYFIYGIIFSIAISKAI